MRISYRYGLAGIAALALLSLVHALRRSDIGWSPAATYLLGVAPNLAAAVAIPMVCLSVWSDQGPPAPYQTLKRRVAITTTASCAGLMAWEFGQQLSRRLVFDLHDLAATVLGSLVALMIFALLTPRTGTAV